jgi:hypothetical protein
MTLKFHPEPGTILICDYTTGFRAPMGCEPAPIGAGCEISVAYRRALADDLVLQPKRLHARMSWGE